MNRTELHEQHCAMLQRVAMFGNDDKQSVIFFKAIPMRQTEDLKYSFEYLATKTQEGFQQNIIGLLEVQQHLTERIKKAKNFHWKSVSFSIAESELTTAYLLRTIGELMGHYDSLNKCLVQINKQQRITEAIIEIQTRALLKKSTDTQSENKA